MKRLFLFYSLGLYYFNERGEKNSIVPSENIKQSLDEILNIIIGKYSGRKSELRAENIPEDDRYYINGDDLIDKIEEKLDGTKIGLA